MGCSSPIEEIPCSGIFNYDKEKEKIYLNSIGKIDFKELFIQHLTPEFQKLFQENTNLFYSKHFYEGIISEYGLFNCAKNLKKAFKIYKDAADFHYDYLCMFRLHRIYLIEYNKFGIKKNLDLHRLYLYKCFAYLPYIMIEKTYLLLNKIDAYEELRLSLYHFDNISLDNTVKFLRFLKTNKSQFKVTNNDIELIESCLGSYLDSTTIKQKINLLDDFFLKSNESRDNGYYEKRLKYCNFYKDYSGDKCDKNKIIKIYDSLIKAEYYKACFDYGRFLLEQKKNDEAKNIFKIGYDNAQHFCLGEYFFLLLRTSDYNQILKDYDLASYIMKYICLSISFDNLGIGTFHYMFYYLIKHSSFQQKIKNEFAKYDLEIYQNIEKLFLVDKNESLKNKVAEKYVIQYHELFGSFFYYGISDIIQSDKEKALIYYKKAYQLSKEKGYGFYKRVNYLFIYKCRKYLFKSNKISLRKLNKTKEKLFRFYEECDLDDLSVTELYNYYKLYKIGVYGNTLNKLLTILKKGKNEDLIYSFQRFVYIEKCKIALEKEYSSNSSLNQNNIIFKNEDFNKDDRNLYFKAMEGQQYALRVPKNIQFIIAIHKLYTKYPELEAKKTGTYVSNGNKINIFDTIQDNGLEDGNIIVIINKVN